MHRRFAQVPHRQEYAQGEDQHHDAESHNQDRLDLRAEGLYFVFDVALVHFRDLEHQSIQVAAFFTHRDHLQHHRIEHPGCGGGAEDALAALHAIAHLLDAAAHEFIVHHHADDIHPLQDRHAALE